MKTFQTIQTNFSAIGFKANDTELNISNIRVTIISILAISSQLAYVFYNVNTVAEYMRSFLMTTIGIGIFISFLTTIFKKVELNDLIDKYQAITTKGKEAVFVNE